ncbi:MAG: formylglycine-generating enzyme family protein [Steroidobacterales bacterium]
MRTVLAIGLVLISGAAAAADRAAIGPATFESVLPPAPNVRTAVVKRFELDRKPVTNGEFLAFVMAHPEWQRHRAASLLVDSQYLVHWRGPVDPGPAAGVSQPVTHVSWFAAKAYCESQGARLPTWYEWELAAAASETLADARRDAAWRQRILDWYARPSTATLADVGSSPPNFYGVFDLHGLVWEWALDYNALLVSNDSREQGGADRAKFCGEGALSTADRENYAVLMRIGFLSSLEANYTTANLGFRCAVEKP